ncbi:Ig-like domain-containing protein [Flavobacterium agrisoli]|uniref:Ig-like domain-containing protein n=1 Tax=Flavobacterium agrisoli TaxID=2793066 RepID=A0A934UJB8_9FLAO|nr:Ig-like domain-containing protein [Flavobacterium agrisoli]MBK0369796.1 Ig-like domain-containing protein [Flavobacterium agrisoli]
MLQKTAKILVIILAFALHSCAKRGSITGGLKDTLAPVLKSSYPKNFSTQFSEKKIRLNFDEYIKLKNINKQLVISPPMKNEPIISPSFASKFIDIKILDTLQPNTTYSLNFGQSVADNNEGNALNQFKYVFSTGDYIDSLKLAGRIKDSYSKEVDHFVSVMLYEINENYTDSIIYKENPRYITNTLDSLETFQLENLKAGKYLLIALKDANNNNKFNPKEDKIGFIKQPITIPTDTLYELELFTEKLPLKAYKPTQASGNRLLMGYDGKQNFKDDLPKIVLKKNDSIVQTIITQYPNKDSLQIWYPSIKADSLQMEVNHHQYQKQFSFKIKNQKKDSLDIRAVQNGSIHFRERFTLESATPLTTFDANLIHLINKDSVAVPYTTDYDVFLQKMYLDFEKKPSEKYQITFLPGALTDFYEQSNDTLSYQLSTKEIEEYGNLRLDLKNAKRFPILIELTNKKGDVVVASAYTEGETKIEFNLLNPEMLSLRAIYDDNKNGQYDAGNFLEKRYSEEVLHFSKEIDVRANWDVQQDFDMSIPYTPEPVIKPKKKKENEKEKEKKRKRNSSIF